MANLKKSSPVVVKETEERAENLKRILRMKGQSQTELTWVLLGGKNFILQKPKTSLEFYSAIKKGVPKWSIDKLAEYMNIPMTKMAGLLNLSYKTLTRKNKIELLDATVSSHAYELAETMAKGISVFEEEEKLNRWLNKENRALNGEKPFDLLNTSTGIRLVNDILGRIEEGVYS